MDPAVCSISSPPEIENFDDEYNCKVCHKIGHGTHYGAFSCRPCAAFFRRTFILNREYKCVKRNGSCGFDLRIGKVVGCRFCRFKKCLDVGMTAENVHMDDVPAQTRENTNSCFSFPKRIGYPISDALTQSLTILVDVNEIIAESRAVLETEYLNYEDETEKLSLNPLEMMTVALQKLRANQESSKNLHFVRKLKFCQVFVMWHQKMKQAAEWLMHAQEFRSLPPHERVEFFKKVWGLWRRFERYTMSAQLFGETCYKEKIFLHSNKYASHIDDLEIDQSEVINPTHNYILKSFMPQWFDVVVKPCIKYNFTPTEVTYMLCQIVWSYAGRRLQGQTLAAAERFCKTIGDNLHEYYEKQNVMHYSLRILRMMRIVNEVLNIQLKRENTMDVAMLFGYFKIVFTDPDFFRV